MNPAWGLIITGIISWVTIPLAFWIPIIQDMPATQRTIFQINFGVVPLIVGTTMAVAGFQMRRLEGYRLAMVASVLPIVVLIFKLIGIAFGTLAINPADIVGAPIGLWALVILTRADVQAAFRSRPEVVSTGESPVIGRSFPWNAFWIGLAALASVLSLIAFAMYWTNSPWPLLGISLPWFVVGAIFGMAGGGDNDMALIAPAVVGHLGATFLASLALVAYAIVLIDSAQPLWMVAVCAAAILSGGTIGYAAASDSESDSTADSSSDVQVVGSHDEAVTDSSGGEVPGGPMILIGTIATITLASSGGDDLLAWLRGKSLSLGWEWRFLVGGPVVVLGGMAMLQRRAYWLAVAGGVACLPLGLGSENVAIRLIPLGLGLYSLYLLTQSEVRESFRHDVRSQADA